ncbi:MAG: alanine racemase [Leptospiraceae bacterium]|nr:alanine racemase [Leptospiraceae bacterium]
MSTQVSPKKTWVRPIIRRQYMGSANKFGGFSAPDSITAIDGVAIEQLREYGSPLFVFSEATLRNKVQQLNQAFANRYPHFQAAWSYKTNYLDAICKVFHDEGSWAEVVSAFEYKKARANGIAANRIIFNGPYKPYAELKQAVAEGALIHADHLDELQDLESIGKELGRVVEIAIRINLDTGMYPAWNRFGFNLESGQAMQAVNRIAASPNLALIGLHCHIGTFMLDAAPYRRAATKMAEFWKNIEAKTTERLRYIDMGGGFASRNKLKSQYQAGNSVIPSFEEYAEAITAPLYEAFRSDQLPQLFVETGRALVDEAGFLVSTVVGSKTMPDGKRFLVADAGVNLLYTSTWYDFKISPAKHYSGTLEDVTLCGPLCMNIDKVRENCLLPDMRRGDQVLIHPVGAYNVTQWMQFIEMRPAVVLIQTNGQVKVIREAESMETLKRQEQS